MANSRKEEFDENILMLYWFPFACLAMSVLAGLVMQSFIVAVNAIDWLKERAMIVADRIITSLEISKVFFHASCLLYFFSLFYFPEYLNFFSKLLALLLHCSGFSNICLSTLYTVFIYIKICTSTNVFFLRLKAIVSRRMTYLIVASFLLTVGYSSMYFLVPPNQFLKNSTQRYISDYKLKMTTVQHFNLMWNIFPILMVFVVSALLILALGFHMRRLISRGNVTSDTNAYRRIIAFTGVSFLIWASYFLTMITEGYAQLLDPLWLLFLMNIFTALHSVLIIYVSTKLRNQFFRIVYYGTDCLFNRKAPGPPSREPMEVIPDQRKDDNSSF